MDSTTRLLRRLAMPAYLPVILAWTGATMMIPVLPLYLTDSGIPLGAASLVLASVGIGGLVGSLPAGELLGRFGEQATMVASLVVMGLALAPLGLTDTVLLLVALRVVFGVASSAMRLSRQTYITRRIVTGQRGRALSFIGGSFRVAALIGPFIGGLLVDVAGYRATFVVAAAISALGLVPASRQARAPLPLLPDVEHATGTELSMLAGMRIHWRRVVLSGPIPVLVMAAREGRFIVLPLIADDLGLSATQVGVLVTISTTADMILFPTAGFLMDRFGRLSAMVPSFSLVATGLLVLATADAAAGVIVAAAVMGVGNGLSSGSMLTLGSDLAPPDAAGPYLAAMALMQGAGSIAGALLVGVVGDALGLGAAAVALAIVLAVALVWLLGVIGESSRPDRIRTAALR